jgi:signal peptidase II
MMSEWPLVAGLVLLLDQISKELFLRRLHPGFGVAAGSAPRIRVVSNPNIGLGLTGNRRALALLFVAVAFAIILLVPVVPFLQNSAALIGVAAALGGAAGNLLDVWRRGAVVDFIDLRIWPVFNFADVAIVAGVALAFWCLMGE